MAFLAVLWRRIYEMFHMFFLHSLFQWWKLSECAHSLCALQPSISDEKQRQRIQRSVIVHVCRLEQKTSSVFVFAFFSLSEYCSSNDEQWYRFGVDSVQYAEDWVKMFQWFYYVFTKWTQTDKVWATLDVCVFDCDSMNSLLNCKVNNGCHSNSDNDSHRNRMKILATFSTHFSPSIGWLAPLLLLSLPLVRFSSNSESRHSKSG